MSGRTNDLVKNPFVYASTGAGLGMLALAWWRVGWDVFLPETLDHAGVAALLLVPLWWIERSIDRRITKAEEATNEVRTDIGVVQSRLDALDADRISEQVIERLIEARAPDEALFGMLRSEPTHEHVARSLWRGRELRMLSDRGVRVELFSTYFLLRFVIPSDDAPSTLEVVLESIEGETQTVLRWGADTPALDFGIRVASYLDSRNDYPGDAAFQFGRVFHALADTVELAFDHRSGRKGVTGSLWPIIEYCPPQWAITDLGVECVDLWRPYQIQAARFGEIDWDPHVTSKSWVDVVSFRRAFDTARELRDRGFL